MISPRDDLRIILKTSMRHPPHQGPHKGNRHVTYHSPCYMMT